MRFYYEHDIEEDADTDCDKIISPMIEVINQNSQLRAENEKLKNILKSIDDLLNTGCSSDDVFDLIEQLKGTS